MTASGHFGRWKPLTLAKNIESVLLHIQRPTLFKRPDLLGVGNAESRERQEHCTNADMRPCAFANMPTMRTLKYRGADVPLGANALEHPVQLISQFDM
jgi:hypothetical protein